MDGSNAVEHLLDQLEQELEEGNVTDAQKTLRTLREELHKRNAWQWLRENEPEDIGELLDKLNLILDQDRLVQSYETVVRQLIEIFSWCKEQGFSVADLKPKDNLHKYREATAYMVSIIDDEDRLDAEKREELTKTLKRIQEQDVTRDDTRAWARTSRDGKS